MYIIKPSWLRHSGEQKDFEVYSCHISPDGKRLATAGGDGHVRVWSTEAIFDSEGPDSGKPRQLCHMSHHLGTIHSDGLVLELTDAVAGTNEPPPIENWKTHKRLVGHDSDVQDLAWSYDNSILVSVGLDSKVVVWSGHTFEKLKTIAVHQSHVKGITFDPANKFFATAGDDRHIKIFRFTPPPPNATQHDMVNNFVLETTISAPFKSSPLTTYFRRCSWSPDGNHIAAANAVNGPVSSVAIIERSRWDSEINLIGHEGPTEGSGSLVTVIASAGQTLSIWNTNTSRPVVILQDVASKSISDLAWTPDGQTLFASSLDGAIVAVKFEGGELGWVATAEENDKALQKYGGSRKGMGTAEDVDGLHLENHSKAGELRGAESRMGALMGDFQPEDKGEAATTNGTKSTSKNGETNGTAEPKASKEAPKAAPAEENAEKAAERIAELKSRVQVTKDGKKRVAPLLVSSSATGLLSLPQSQLVGAKSTTKTTQNDTPQTILDLSKPFHGLPRGGIAAMLLGNKRKAAAIEGEEEEEPSGKRPSTGPVPILVDTPDGLESAPLSAPSHGLVPTPEYLRPAVISPAIAVSQVRLAVPKIRSHILRPLEKGVLQGQATLEEATKIPENTVLEAKNPIKPREPSHITASKRGALLWQDFLPRAIILVTGNKHFWAAACEDGSLPRGAPRRKSPSSPEHWLLCITSVGLCHVFNIKTMSAPHPPISLARSHHLPLPGPHSRRHLRLNSAGATLQRRRLLLPRHYWNSNDSSISALAGEVSVSAGIIPYLERHTTAEFLLKGRAFTLQRLIKTLLSKDGKFRDLQRLTVQYARILGLTADGEAQDEDEDEEGAAGGGQGLNGAERMEVGE
ncbi:HIR complex subunit [Staphylotrichum longicolle]|uniref:Protein HIR n=1 Tax=Staphylotrichum longicolle TaxID=669026 RepID=A0AAD4ES63_9PEZI|nr:HIR complex subunit [Staphylotrichum longicolle]